MRWDSEPTLVDPWDAADAGDEQHQDDRPQRSREETAVAANRFRFATQRRRIPLSSNPAFRILTIDAEPPPARLPEGSSAGVRPVRELAPIAVEVRLRRDLSPSAAQVDDVLSWLRIHRAARPETSPRASGDGSNPPAECAARGTPRPQLIPPPAPPPPVLEPVISLEPPRRGSLWPLVALSIGLAAALVAAMLL